MQKTFKYILAIGIISGNIPSSIYATSLNPNTIINEAKVNTTENLSLGNIEKCFQNKPYGLSTTWTDDGTFLNIVNSKNDTLLKFHKSGKVPNDTDLYSWAGCGSVLSEFIPMCKAESCVSVDSVTIKTVMDKLADKIKNKEIGTIRNKLVADVSMNSESAVLGEFTGKFYAALMESTVHTALLEVFKYKDDLEKLANKTDLNKVNNGMASPSDSEVDLLSSVFDVVKNQPVSEVGETMKMFKSFSLLPTSLTFGQQETKARFAAVDCDFELAKHSEHKMDIINAYLTLLGIGEKQFTESPFVKFSTDPNNFKVIKDIISRSLVYSPVKKVFYLLFLDRSKVGENSDNCSEPSLLQMKYNANKKFGYDGNGTMHLYWKQSQKYVILPFDKFGFNCALFYEILSSLKKGNRFSNKVLKDNQQNIFEYDILADFEQPLTVKTGKKIVFRPHIAAGDKSDWILEK